MRLIDADALIRKFKTASPMAIDGRARQIVNDAPTVYPDCNISSDGTLTVTVSKGTHVGRVLVQEDGTRYGGLFYPDEDRKRSKWIQNDNGTYSCGLCQSWIPKEQYHYARFCLHCGAVMEGEQ